MAHAYNLISYTLTMEKNMNLTHDFGDGAVPAYKHPEGGGWVANTARVAHTAYVGPQCKVLRTGEGLSVLPLNWKRPGLWAMSNRRRSASRRDY